MAFTTPEVIQQGNNYHVKHGDDSSLYVKFDTETIIDEEKSIEAGRTVYVDREYVKIIPVGDKHTVICRPIRLEETNGVPPDNLRWPVQYNAFKNQQVQPQEGTPLEHWAPLTKSQVMNFKAVNVHTVEHLANVSDQNLNNLGMGARKFRDMAIKFIEDAKKGASSLKAQKEIDDLKTQVEALKNQLQGFKDAGVDNDEPATKGKKTSNKKKSK